MPAVTGPALVAAALLALAGAQKLLDPTMTVGALRALRIPATPRQVRVGSAAELALGVAAAVVGGWPLWVMVAASYGAFGVFLVVALRSGAMIGSCGCFGREDTPPHWSHVILDAGLAAVAVWAAVDAAPAPVAEVIEGGLEGALVGGLAATATGLLYAAFVLLPRAVVRPTSA